MKTSQNKLSTEGNPELNLVLATPLSEKAGVMKQLFPLLRHLNPGTLSCLMMVGLALLDAMRGTNSPGISPSVGKTERAPDVDRCL